MQNQDLNNRILEKVAKKSERGTTSLSVMKRVSANSRRKHISYRVGLILEARKYNIGTAFLEKALSDSEIDQLRTSLTATPIKAPQVTKKFQQSKPKKISEAIKYESENPFIKGHILELNRAYTFSCFTAVFILGRKIIENLIVDILRKKFPETSKQNKELYFDIVQNRFRDFGVILENLHKKKNEFGTENKAVEKLYVLAKKFKDDSNDKVHSWYHLVKKKGEIDELELQTIIDLIVKIESHVGIR